MSDHDHEHGHGEELENPGGLDLPLITTVFIAGAALLLITVLATTAWVKTRQVRINEAQSYNKSPYEVQVYQKDQDKKLNTLGRNDDGSIRVPIDQAMEIYAKQKP